MCGKIKRRVLWGIVLASICIWLITVGSASAGRHEVLTTTGTIVAVKGMVITLNAVGTFYPAMPIKVPDWAIKGAKASMSYRVKKGRNYYYEIVKPGERLKIKEELEAQAKKGY